MRDFRIPFPFAPRRSRPRSHTPGSTDRHERRVRDPSRRLPGRVPPHGGLGACRRPPDTAPLPDPPMARQPGDPGPRYGAGPADLFGRALRAGFAGPGRRMGSPQRLSSSRLAEGRSRSDPPRPRHLPSARDVPRGPRLLAAPHDAPRGPRLRLYDGRPLPSRRDPAFDGDQDGRRGGPGRPASGLPSLRGPSQRHLHVQPRERQPASGTGPGPPLRRRDAGHAPGASLRRFPRETNSNFGFNLPWWDRILGTYRDRPAAGHDGMTIGLVQFQEERRQTLPWLLLLPFRGGAGRYPIGRRGGG